MARQTEVVLLLILATAAAALANDYDKFVKEAKKDGTDGCPADWVKYEELCYIYKSTAKDWASAENYCLNLNAHLVSVHSEDEYHAVKAVVRYHDFDENPSWIGLSGCQKQNNFFWSDGTKFTYTKWNRGQPDFQPGEACVVMNWDDLKNWNDITCNIRYPFVCAKMV